MLKPTISQIRKYGKEIANKVIEKTNGKCWYCSIELLPTKRQASKSYLDHMCSFDHLNPKSNGGQNSLDNLVPACRKCNEIKANGGVDYLRAKLLFEKHKWPKFSLQLFNFLQSKGVELHRIIRYDDQSEHFEFYFEKENLNG